jgi:hypothetical protein
MTLSDFASIATITEAVFVIISVYFIWRELRENVKLTKAANNQSLVEISSPFNMQLIQDRQMAELWVSGTKKYPEMDEVDKYRYLSLLTWWLILQENIYYQHASGLLDGKAYSPWKNDLEEFVKGQKLWLYWDGMKSNYQAEFAAQVCQIANKYRGLDNTGDTRKEDSLPQPSN